MAPLPYPESPTQQEVIAENTLIRQFFFITPPFILTTVIIGGLLIAICMAANFNPMNWLE